MIVYLLFSSVFDEVQRILDEHKPEVVTIEHPVTVDSRVSKPVDLDDYQVTWRLGRARFVFGSLEYQVLSHGRKTVIQIDDFFVYGHPDTDEWETLEYNATIDFAIRQGLPFYFIDWSQDFPDRIFKFWQGRLRSVSIAEHTTYQNYPKEFSTDEGVTYIAQQDIVPRNRFMADAINYLLDYVSIVSHTGGNAHFSSEWGQDNDQRPPLPPPKGLELQNLVNAERKVVYDLVKGTKQES